MNTDPYWNMVADRLETVRSEAATRRQLKQVARVNLWARLLPPLRRLESWLERHAGSDKQRRPLASP